MNRNHSRDIVSKTGSRESQTPAESSNEEFDSKVARLTAFGYSKVDIQQALKCDQGSLCRSILRLSKSQGSSSSDVGSRHALDKSSDLGKTFSQKINRNQEIAIHDRTTGVSINTGNLGNSTTSLSGTDSPGTVNRVSVKVNRNQLPANLPIDVEHRDLTDRITQILEAARGVQSARKSNRPDVVQKAFAQLQKSARPEDIITIKKTLNDIQARVKAAKTIREAQAFTGYVLDKCDVSIRSQVAKVLSLVGLQNCIPSQMAYLYEHVVVD